MELEVDAKPESPTGSPQNLRVGLNSFAFFAIMIWGLNYVSLKFIFLSWTVPAALLFRFLIMWAGLWIVCLVKKDLTPLQKEDAWQVLYLGFVNMGVYMVVFMNGMNLTIPPEGALVFSSAPLFTAIGACFMKREGWRLKTFFGILLGLGGIGVVEFPLNASTGSHAIGNLLVLGSVLLWTHAALMMPKLHKNYSSLRLFTLSMTGAFPLLFAYGIIPVTRMDWRHIWVSSWLGMLYSAIFSGIVGFTLFYKGVSQIGPSRTTRYQMLLPIWTGLFAMALLKERLGISFLIGTALVLFGLFIASDRRPTSLA